MTGERPGLEGKRAGEGGEGQGDPVGERPGDAEDGQAVELWRGSGLGEKLRTAGAQAAVRQPGTAHGMSSKSGARARRKSRMADTAPRRGPGTERQPCRRGQESSRLGASPGRRRHGAWLNG